MGVCMSLLNLIKCKKTKEKNYKTNFIKPYSELDALEIKIKKTKDVICIRESVLHSDINKIDDYNDRIKKVNQVKNDIAKFVTEDIGIYLNSIIRFSSDLLKENRDALSNEEIKKILKIKIESKELLGALSNANLIVKTENFQVEPNKDLFNIIEIVDEVKSDLIDTILQKNLKFEQFLYSEESIPIYSDRLKVKRILSDLLSHSIKDTMKGTIGLTIDIKDSNYCIRLQDEGKGICDDELDFVFDEFFMVTDRSYISKRAISKDLDLYNIKQLVELLGGSIEVESKEEEGSCFTIYLPIGN